MLYYLPDLFSTFFLRFRLTQSIKKKKKPITIQGIAIPVLPPVDEVTKHINDQLVESFQHDPLLEPIEYDAEVIKLLNEGKVYIGMCLIFNIILISSLIFFFFKIILSIKLFRQRNNSSSYY